MVGLGLMVARESNNEMVGLSAMAARDPNDEMVGLGATAANGLAQDSSNKSSAGWHHMAQRENPKI